MYDPLTPKVTDQLNNIVSSGVGKATVFVCLSVCLFFDRSFSVLTALEIAL